MEVVVPQLAWFGDRELKLKFPEKWDVNVQIMRGHGKRSVNEEEIVHALSNPVGTKPLSKLARGKKEVVIIFDDMTRPTKVYEVVPHIINELHRAGIKDDNIRFVCANGSHGVLDREDFVKKLGESAVVRSICYNHGDLGGFSTAQDHRKVHPSCELAYGRVNEENVLRLDSEEAASLIGLDMIVNVLVDLRRNSTDVFVGDVIKAQREGVEVAKEHYLTPVIPEADIVVSNAYSKASEATIASWPVLTLKEEGDFVLIVNAPTGQVTHYVHGRWGTKVFGDLYLAPPNILDKAGRIILFSEYHERQPWLELVPPEKTLKVRTWDEVIEELKNKHKNKAKVAVYPDATIQKPF